MRAPRTSALGLAALLALGACTGGGDEVSKAARAGGAKLSGGGIEIIPPADRTTPLRATGTTLEGAPVDTRSYAGEVVVLNTWGSWCPPCNREAPDLQRTWVKVEQRGVQFVGVHVGESATNGKAFQRKYSVTYPSLDEGEQVLLQLKGKASTTPATLILDRQGRLAARVLTSVTEKTLTGLIDDVLNERA